MPIKGNKLNRDIPSWDKVERQIYKEVEWLRNAIDIFSTAAASDPVAHCNDCMLRNIAILIISGNVKAREIKKLPTLPSFWLLPNNIAGPERPEMRHGKEWHRNTMGAVEKYFLYKKYTVTREPNLYWGRADLGIYKSGEKDLLVEIGTTSLFKLWINLEVMENFDYLIIPRDNKLIEFVVPPHLKRGDPKKLELLS